MSATKTTGLDKTFDATQATDAFWVDPTHLDLGHNSRIHAEADEKQSDLNGAVDIFESGQQQACVVRRKEDGKLELVAGFGRLRRVNLIRGGFEIGGKRFHDADRKLLVRVDESIKTDEDAFAASVRENVRKEVSPVNIAAQQEVLRKDFKWTDKKIAVLYGYNNSNAIKRNKDLLAAPKEVQELVHKGELAVDPALKLLKLPKTEQKALLESGEKLTGPKVTEALIRHADKVADAKPDGGKGETGGGKKDDADKTPTVSRNAAALKKYLTESVLNRSFDDEPLVDTNPVVCKLLQGIVDYLNGIGQEQRLWNRIDEVLQLETPVQPKKK